MGDHGSPLQQNYSNIPNGFPEEPRNKKSQNMTECVPVPSSEHVAEIVGRQGENAKPKLYFQSYFQSYACSSFGFCWERVFRFISVIIVRQKSI